MSGTENPKETTATRKRWKVEYRYQSGWGLGPTSRGTPSYHRTFFGADWYRRFRAKHFTFGTMQVLSIPSRVAEALPQDEGTQNYPRYAKALDAVLWPVLYFIRSRWDGIRFGRDRDKMDW